MRGLLFAAGLLLVSSAALADAPAARPLDGDWTVDLRLSLDDEPYSQPMKLATAADGTVSGEFYSSAIVAGRAGAAQGRSCVFFRTEDPSGPYHTTACLVDGKLIGQSWSEGRNFVLPWTASRN